MSERHLQRAFHAAIVAASALHCGGIEDGTGDASDDATGADARVDVTDGDASVGPVFVVDADAAYVWCEAGPPRPVEIYNCVEIVDVPCKVPLDWYADDAGDLYHCDQICGTNVPCSVVDAAIVDAALDDAGVYVGCGCAFGRRPAGYRTTRAPTNIGEYFANMARLEAASVFAFERLHVELEQMNAPTRLLARVRRATNDEHRHARIVERVAKRFGGVTIRPHAPMFRSRAMERFAIENAVEGCVREMYGALVATWQSLHARDPHVQRMMRIIARDETRHAALAVSVAAFVSDKLDEKSRVHVEGARHRAISELRTAATQSPDRNLASVAGLPSPAQARALVDHYFGASSTA